MTLLIGDVAGRTVRPRNQTTARDLAMGTHAIVTGRTAGAEATRYMRTTRAGQHFPVLACVLPDGVTWGSKSGWVDGVERDVAFIDEPGGAGIRCLAACTRGFAGRDGQLEIVRTARERLSATVEHAATVPCSAELRAELTAALPPAAARFEAVCRLDTRIGRVFADAARATMVALGPGRPVVSHVRAAVSVRSTWAVSRTPPSAHRATGRSPGTSGRPMP